MPTPCIAQHFRDQLRIARASAFRDAEGFQEILFVIERLGFMLTNNPDAHTLEKYKAKIQKLSKNSVLAEEIPASWRHLHTPMSELYEIVRIARNDAVHQGALARHLTTHAVELALVLEDALMDGSNKPTVWFYVISLVANTCGHDGGRIGPTHCALIDGAPGDKCSQCWACRIPPAGARSTHSGPEAESMPASTAAPGGFH